MDSAHILAGDSAKFTICLNVLRQIVRIDRYHDSFRYMAIINVGTVIYRTGDGSAVAPAHNGGSNLR